MDEVTEHLGRECSGRVLLVPFEVEHAVFTSADSPGETIAERIVAQGEAVATASGTETGVDVHVGPDGRAYLTQVVC